MTPFTLHRVTTPPRCRSSLVARWLRVPRPASIPQRRERGKERERKRNALILKSILGGSGVNFLYPCSWEIEVLPQGGTEFGKKHLSLGKRFGQESSIMKPKIVDKSMQYGSNSFQKREKKTYASCRDPPRDAPAPSRGQKGLRMKCCREKVVRWTPILGSLWGPSFSKRKMDCFNLKND